MFAAIVQPTFDEHKEKSKTTTDLTFRTARKGEP